MNDVFGKIRSGLDEIKVIDIHSHLGSSGVWQARDLPHLVSYFWLSMELARAKGAPVEADPRRDPEGYMREVVPYFPAIRNTFNHYAFMAMLRDLYGYEGRTLTGDTWRDVDAKVRAAAEDPDRFVKVLDRSNVEKVFVAHGERGMPHPSGRCIPYGYGEPLFALEERSQAEAISGAGAEPPASLDELADGIRGPVESLANEKKIRALHTWVRGTWVYREVSAGDAAPIYKRVIAGEDVAPEERDGLMSFTADVTADAAAAHGVVIQIFHGMIAHTQGPTPHCVSYFNPEFLRALTRHFWRHKETRYDLFFGTRAASHESASIARIYPNVSVSGGWWHGFSPQTLTEFFRDRLELLPNTAWNAFYSDGRMVEWVYGKLAVSKNRLAHALAGMVTEGFITEDDALDIARKLLHDNPAQMYGLK